MAPLNLQLWGIILLPPKIPWFMGAALVICTAVTSAGTRDLNLDFTENYFLVVNGVYLQFAPVGQEFNFWPSWRRWQRKVSNSCSKSRVHSQCDQSIVYFSSCSVSNITYVPFSQEISNILLHTALLHTEKYQIIFMDFYLSYTFTKFRFSSFRVCITVH